jgi:hypothetical protein
LEKTKKIYAKFPVVASNRKVTVMKAQTYLHIPKPCHEDWNKMSPTQQGRHCESCCKTVVDFEMMTDQQVLNFFAHAKGETCGRFGSDQLNRPLEETKVDKKKGWQWFVATIASLFFFMNRSNAQGKVVMGKPMPPANRQATVKEQKNIKSNQSVQKRKTKTVISSVSTQGLTAVRLCAPIEREPVEAAPLPLEEHQVVISQKMPQLIGSVTDENGNAIAYATISVRTINGLQNFSTNEAGEFFVNNPLKLGDEVELKFSSMGYEDKSVPLTFDESKLELHVQLKEKAKQLDEVVVVGYQTTRHKEVYGGAVMSVSVKQVQTMDTVSTIIKKAMGMEAFKIFPNPASKGKAVNLTINETGDYSVQLLDNESRLMTAQNISVSAKKEIKLFNIPSTISSGMYYIRLVNEKNKKQYTDKIFVQ